MSSTNETKKNLSNEAASNSKLVALHELPPPPFTIKELRDAIPAHCFKRSLLRSFSYIVFDCLAISALFLTAYYYNNNLSGRWVVSDVFFWMTYWFIQGAVMTGLWVIAHECGHQSFSDYKIVNNTVGWILHSALLVPYHSWRISHGMHHKSTSHMERDQVYVPKTWEQITLNVDVHNLVSDSPLVNFLQIFIMLLVGWPFYLATNAWSQDHGKRANHFEPWSPIFKNTQFWDVVVSDLGIILATCVFGYISYTYSFTSFAKYYFAPYLWVNFWLVLITYLQHTDVRVPHFRGEQWNFIRGALCTVDRDYGIFNILHHHIGDTHVAHHLFSTMPHYHAQEATEALKKVLGKYYLTDDTPIMKALWKSWTSCHYVEDNGDVLQYRAFVSAKKAS